MSTDIPSSPNNSAPVLILTGTTHCSAGGRIMCDWCRHLRSVGWPVHVGFPGGGSLGQALDQEHVPTLQVDLSWPRKLWPFPFLRQVGRLCRYCRRQGIGLIHANGENDYPLARLVARILRIPVSCHIHNGNPRSRDFCQWLFSKEPRPARLVFVSDCQRQQNAAALAGILPSEHCITVHNGVDIEAFRPADAQFRTLSRNAWGLDESAYVVAVIASVKAHKQNHHILEVLGLLRQRGVDAIGVLAGPILEPEYGRWILAEAEKQGLADQVKVLGNIEQVQQAYAAADVVACFSQSEGFSLVTLEAMACGKAIVSYNHPAQVEAIGDAGVCVEMNRHDLVAAVCLELYREPNRREEVGRAARRRVEDSFSASSVSRKLQGVFQAILDEAAGARQERSRRG